MKRTIIPALIVLSVICIASFLSSTQPDGLESVLEKLGISGNGTFHRSLFQDYTVKFFDNSPLGSIFSGIAGAALCAGTFLAVRIIVLKINRSHR